MARFERCSNTFSTRVRITAVQGRFLSLIIFFVVLLLHFAVYASVDNQIAVEITPSTVQLAPGEAINGLVVVRNTSSSVTLNNLRLSTIGVPKNLIQIPSISHSVLSPNEEYSWDFTLVSPATESIIRKVYFRLSYQQKGSNGQILTRDVVYPLEVQDNPFLPLGKIATARVETTLSLLQERRKNFFYLIVTNVSNVPVQVKNITHQQPEFLELTLVNASTPIELAPQESKIFTFQAIAQNAVQAGQEIVVFDVAISWEERSQHRNGTLVAVHKFDASIVGESEILKLIGVPLFFLVPGALILLVFQNLWDRSVSKIPLDMATFWIVAIPLSLTLTLFYPVLSGWLGASRDLLVAYGLRDILNVWLISVLLGFLAWFIGACGREMHLRYITPTKGEKVDSLLSKLARLDVGLQLRPVNINRGGIEKEYFIVGSDFKDTKKCWVIPPIKYQWKKGGKANLGFANKFRATLDKGSIDELVKLVQSDKGENVELCWSHSSQEGPTKINSDQIGDSQSLKSFIDIYEES